MTPQEVFEFIPSKNEEKEKRLESIPEYNGSGELLRENLLKAIAHLEETLSLLDSALKEAYIRGCTKGASHMAEYYGADPLSPEEMEELCQSQCAIEYAVDCKERGGK